MNEFELQHLPEAYRPLSPWSYFGLGILYALPLLGWIFLILTGISVVYGAFSACAAIMPAAISASTCWQSFWVSC